MDYDHSKGEWLVEYINGQKTRYRGRNRIAGRGAPMVLLAGYCASSRATTPPMRAAVVAAAVVTRRKQK